MVLPRNFGHRLRAGAFGRQQIAEGKQKDEKNEGIRGFQSFSGAFRLGFYPSKRRELWESLSPLGRRAVQHRRAARPREARS